MNLTQAYRHLRKLAPEDRTWILARLSSSAKMKLARGLGADGVLYEPTATAKAMRRLDARDGGVVLDALKGEPSWIVWAVWRAAGCVRGDRKGCGGAQHHHGNEGPCNAPGPGRHAVLRKKPASPMALAVAASTTTTAERMSPVGITAQPSLPWTKALMKPTRKVASSKAR